MIYDLTLLEFETTIKSLKIILKHKFKWISKVKRPLPLQTDFKRSKMDQNTLTVGIAPISFVACSCSSTSGLWLHSLSTDILKETPIMFIEQLIRKRLYVDKQIQPLLTILIPTSIIQLPGIFPEEPVLMLVQALLIIL